MALPNQSGILTAMANASATREAFMSDGKGRAWPPDDKVNHHYQTLSKKTGMKEPGTFVVDCNSEITKGIVWTWFGHSQNY